MELKNYFTQDDQGNALSGATCYLYLRGTESLAQQVQKANGYPLTNPFQADEHGHIQFAAANGLYDLRVVKGIRDYRLSVQCNDVSDDLEAAEGAADRAESARDAAQVSAGVFMTVAAGLAATPVDGKFQVLAPENDVYVILYKNNAGVALELKRYPSVNAVKAVSDLVSSTTHVATETSVLVVTDPEGATLSTLTNRRLETPGFDVVSDESARTIIGDAEGGVSIYVDAERAILGGLEVQQTSMPGVFITDEDGGVLQDFSQKFQIDSTGGAVSPFDGGLLFTPVIATAENEDACIYAQGLIPHRENSDSVISSLSSQVNSYSVTAQTMPVSATKAGENPILNLRLKSQPDVRYSMNLTIKNVPVQSPVVPLKILWIGDSITNFAGPLLLERYLVSLGFSPTFLGTLPSSGIVNTATGSSPETDTTGPLAEARPGWESGDYTYAVDNRAQIVAIGDEAAYLALEKSEKFKRNPFLRAATGSDTSETIRNGYVFDPAFYQSRFGLETPDIVINTMGTNDARDLSSSSVYEAIYANDVLMHNQILKAWPAAKILRSLPGTSYNSTRNAIWASHYVPIIRALKAAALSVGSKVSVAPLWAMTNPEVAYAISVFVPVGDDGFKISDWSDNTHPSGASRHALFKTMAPFVAAAKLNLI